MQIPRRVPAPRVRRARSIALPAPGDYGVGMVFLPRDVAAAQRVPASSSRSVVREEGQTLLGWRDVPVDAAGCRAAGARRRCRRSARCSSARGAGLADQDALERKLYVIRKRVEQLRRATSGLPRAERFYVPSLSSRTIVYKGLLLPEQIPAFYPDLTDPTFESALALVHQRF